MTKEEIKNKIESDYEFVDFEVTGIDPRYVAMLTIPQDKKHSTIKSAIFRKENDKRIKKEKMIVEFVDAIYDYIKDGKMEILNSGFGFIGDKIN